MYNRQALADNTKSVNITKFLKQTYQLFASSLLAAAAGVYIGLSMLSTISGFFWGFVIVELILLFTLYAVKHKQGINLIVLFLFTLFSGLTTAPLVGAMLSTPAGASLVGQAFLMTALAFGSISMFALTTKQDFSFMGKFLMVSVIILVVGVLLNVFFFQNPMMQLIIAMAGAIIFSAFILYDTQQIIKGNVETPIEGAIALYLDFLNLFISLAQILLHFNRDD